MARGVPTPEETVAAFRAEYLYSGNASASARAVGLDERVGRTLAREFEETPEFAEGIRKLHAHALNKLIAMRMRVAEVAANRLEAELPVPENVEEGGNVTIIDKRADYGRLVLDAEKNAQNWARLEGEKNGDIPTEREVVIRVESFSGAKRAAAEEPGPSGEAA